MAEEPGGQRDWHAAGSLDIDKMIASLRANKFETVLGKIGFDMKGDVTAPGYVWYVWKDGGYDYATIEANTMQ